MSWSSSRASSTGPPSAAGSSFAGGSSVGTSPASLCSPTTSTSTTTTTGGNGSVNGSAETTVAFLERLTIVGIESLNTGDHALTQTPENREVRQHISPDWRGVIDTNAHPKELTWLEQVAMFDERRRQCPNVRFEVVSITTDLDEEKGEALQFMEMDIHGLASFSLQALNEITWRRIKGEWMITHTLGLRGTRGNSGALG